MAVKSAVEWQSSTRLTKVAVSCAEAVLSSPKAEDGKSPEERTMQRVQEMANFLVEGIGFTVDLPGRHESRKVPMLDLALWIDIVECGSKKSCI